MTSNALFRVILCLSLLFLYASEAKNISLEICCDNAQDATTWSLVYGIPLIAFANQTTKVFQAVGGANKINTQSELASVSGAAVVKPNVDTVYSRVIVDLSKDDLVLTVPNITDRFWIFPFYDTFGNNFASLSPVTDSKPGKYLIRRSDDALVEPGLQLFDHGKNRRSNSTSHHEAMNDTLYEGAINYPTTYGTILIRILVKQNTTEDRDIVHGYQSQYSITPAPRTKMQPGTPSVPTVSTILNNATTNVTTASAILGVLAQIASYNQPEILAERYKVASILGLAGLVNGKYTMPPSVNITKAYEDAISTYTNITSRLQNINEVGNGWQLGISAFEGNFTTNYAPRALVAQTGYQQLVPDIVIYPGWNTGSFGSYELGANESFLFTFSAKPPIKGSSSLYPTNGVSAEQAGFWSLTVYGPDQYLINNTLNRYEVGDRTTSLAYEDGTLVYQPEASNAIIKPFKVLMQRADVVPPTNWTGNWLPSPPGGGALSFILRFYRPFPELMNGSYVYPLVQRVPLIQA